LTERTSVSQQLNNSCYYADNDNLTWGGGKNWNWNLLYVPTYDETFWLLHSFETL